MFNNIFEILKNYLGDYSPQKIDHKKYEVDVVSQGADSGEALYIYCLKFLDNKFSNQQNLRILDLACGNGPFAKYVIESGRKYIIDGIDIFVPERERLEGEGIYRKVIETDITTFDFQTVRNQYDIIISNQFFEHLSGQQAFDLLYKLTYSGASILLSVPLPYQTFAYSEDYLKASLKENTDFSDLLLLVTNAEVHKTYFTSRIMNKLEFMRLPQSVFHSNFFYRSSNLKPVEQKLNADDYYRLIKNEKIDKVWRKYLVKINPNRTSLPKREEYEKKLVIAMLLEPISYKIIRKFIYILTNPLRFVLKAVKPYL